MATARKLPSGMYRTLVYDGKDASGKRIYQSFTADTKKESEFLAAQYLINKKDNEYNKAGSMTLHSAVSSYIETKSNVLSESTIIGYKAIQKNYMPSISHLRLEQFTKPIVQKWVNDISVGRSPKTVKNAFGLFSATMEFFTDKHFKVKFPQARQTEIYIPSDDDIKTLLMHCSGDFKLAMFLAAFGGLRRGEICALERSDVYNDHIIINKSMGMTQDRTWIIKVPKTECSNRIVYLPKFVISELKKKDGRIVEMTPDHITDRFCVLRDKLGMKSFRFHDLRHYYASINHAIGIPDQYIMEMGGWKTDRTMKAVYRNTLAPEKEMFMKKSLSHFENMQHEMQHEKEKAP